MNESMVDRVARALALADLDDETREIVDLGAHMAHVRGHYEDLARTAIEAMRTPTDAMIEAGYDAADDAITHPGAESVFEAMIDAALNDKEQQE